MRFFHLLTVSILLCGADAQVSLSEANLAREKAFNWLVDQWRPELGSWEDSQTSRIITSLQLIDSTWLFDSANSKAVPSLQRMNADILDGLTRTNNMATITGEEGAEMVNAALATCQNPRDFYGKNLIEMLRKRLDTIPSGSKTKNVVQVAAAALALCNAGESVPLSAIQRINSELKPTSGVCPYCVEASSIAIIAMKCVKQQMPNEQLVQGITTRQIAYIKGKQAKDGGFGNLVGTALATQAANSVGTVNLPVNVASSLGYLLADQDSEGSFGNTVLNGLVLPTLIGRSLLDVKGIADSCPDQKTLDDLRTKADPTVFVPPSGPSLAANALKTGEMLVRLSVEDNIYAQRFVETSIITKADQTLLQIMNEWSNKHPRAFQFTTGLVNGATQLTGVNSVSNDEKNNWMWSSLLIAAGTSNPQPTTAGLDKTTVKNGDKIVFRFGPK